MGANVGRWAFLAGLILSVIIGLFNASWAAPVLLVLGLIVGFLNVAGAEAQSFLVAAIALIITASSLNGLPLIGGLAADILEAAVIFISAATVVVAIKGLFETAQS